MLQKLQMKVGPPAGSSVLGSNIFSLAKNFKEVQERLRLLIFEVFSIRDLKSTLSRQKYSLSSKAF